MSRAGSGRILLRILTHRPFALRYRVNKVPERPLGIETCQRGWLDGLIKIPFRPGSRLLIMEPRTRGKKDEEIYGPGDGEQIETSGFLTGRRLVETIARYTHICPHNYTSKRIIRLSGEIERERRLSALVILTNAPSLFHAPFEIESPAGGQSRGSWRFRVGFPGCAPPRRRALSRGSRGYRDTDAGTGPAGKTE